MAWLIVLLLAVIIEVILRNYFAISFGAGALIAFIAEKIGLSFIVQTGIFEVSVLLCLFIFQLLVRKSKNTTNK